MADIDEEVELSENVEFSESSSNDGDISDGEEETDVKEEVEGNQGWANVMASILNKKVSENKAPVLSKSKRIKREREEKTDATLKTKIRAMERQMLEKDHVIPDGSNIDYEKKLQKIATRGAVKLFNAVSKHQKELESKLQGASTESKKAKVMKNISKSDFLDMLKNSSTIEGKATENNNKKQSSKNIQDETDKSTSSWNILRDDFMMGAKMKDWDKVVEEENEGESLSESEEEEEEEIEFEND